MEAFQYHLYGLSQQSDEMAVVARRIQDCADGLRAIVNSLEAPLKDSEDVDQPLRRALKSTMEQSQATIQYQRSLNEIVDIYGASNQRVFISIEETAILSTFPILSGMTHGLNATVPTPFHNNAVVTEDWLLAMSYENNGPAEQG